MKWSEIVESAGKPMIAYHGGNHPEPHDNMYFSSDPDFAKDYGKVYQYKLSLGRMFDSLDKTVIEPLLPLYDPYDETYIETIDDYMARSSDTWEIIEQYLTSIKGAGYNSVRIFEGGVENYFIFDKDSIKLLGQKR